MVVNRKVKGTATSMPGGLAAGMIISIVVTVVGALIAAHLISKEIISQESAGYCSMFILLLASLTGSWIACGKIKRRRLMVCGMSGLIYYALLLATTALFFDGIYEGMGVTALLIICGSALTALIGTRGQGSSARRRKQIRHR